MKSGILCIAAIFLILLTACKQHKEICPVSGIVERIAPQFAEDILFEQMESSSGKDVFELESLDNGKILIRGNNSISMAMGLNHYLKYYCLTSVSWFVDQPVQLPKVMPDVPEKIRKVARVEKRYFLNYCTYSYTMPWWQWRDWERLIDWMALNGINMPLAITGQESVWYNVWKNLGLTDEEIRNYFTGPTHLHGHRLTNIDSLGGPLPHSYINHQLELQKEILERERKLGMTPVLSAFSGHVPSALERIFPKAKISRLGNAFMDNPYRCYILDPGDTLFVKIQKAFIEEQTRLFGTDHIYAADPLNEIEPPSWEPEYLAELSGAIYKSMSEADENAEWLQMGWLFYFSRDHWTNERIEATLTAVPQGKMILLDYFCENTEVWKMTESFFGQPYIWCYLGNFGGRTVLAGNMETAGKRLDYALKSGGENLIGIGSTLEGMGVNPMVYEYIFEKAWESDSTDLNIWFDHWADRRCGYEDEYVREAWQILMDNIYTSVQTDAPVTIINLRPTFTRRRGDWNSASPASYSNAILFHAWELMLNAGDQTRDAWQYDIVNIGRQVLGNHFLELRDRFTSSYHEKDLALLEKTGAEMKELLMDMDSLLSTRYSFLMGHWIKDARMFGTDADEADYYERNARLLITSFAGFTHLINDYANRNWAGLTETFYASRWEMFIDDVIEAVEKREPFNEEAFFEKVTAFENNWADETEKHASEPVGNSIVVASQLSEKYRSKITP